MPTKSGRNKRKQEIRDGVRDMGLHFRREREHRHPRPRMPLFAVILMIIGLMTVLYFAIFYGLMPVLAMLTPA